MKTQNETGTAASKAKNPSPHTLFHVASGLFLAVSLLVLVLAGVVVAYQDLKQTYLLSGEILDLMENQCRKYDNFVRGVSAKSVQEILDTITGLDQFVDPEKKNDSHFLNTFIRSEHLSGVILLDDTLSMTAQADLDDQDAYALWREVIQRPSVKDILDYPGKKYADHAIRNGISYEYAVIARRDAPGLILGYLSDARPSKDLYGYTIDQILLNDRFHKNALVVLSDGKQILSSNKQELIGQDAESCILTKENEVSWKNGMLTLFQCHNEKWYGVRRVYNAYELYVAYPSSEVFSNQKHLILLGFMLYLALGMGILFVQRHLDKKNLENLQKQLSIINAISLSYTSIFLYDIKQSRLETVKISPELDRILKNSSGPEAFLARVCERFLDPKVCVQVRQFLNPEDMAERIRGKSYLGTEFQSRNGSWYSIALVPQRTDENGQLEVVLAAVRDITSIKQATELSFKDHLTGLFNRNYMEVKGRRFVEDGKLPVSLIMADCNYLKRTNDTLGHEYGDRLLKKIASILRETIPGNCEIMRIGGDEFLILGRECPRSQAEQIVEQIRSRFARESEADIPLSAAFGIHTTEEGTFSFEKAYYLADQAMYQNKKETHR